MTRILDKTDFLEAYKALQEARHEHKLSEEPVHHDYVAEDQIREAIKEASKDDRF